MEGRMARAGTKQMDLASVKRAYARWAPVYDWSFGAVSYFGRKRAVHFANEHKGHVLEVGVGTGMSLSHYHPEVRVTGIDVSRDMLERARRRVADEGLSHVEALEEMDAQALRYPDETFDTVAAMHVVSVVPDPARVMAEMARVCKTGGQVLVLNHFARAKGPLHWIEKTMAPFAKAIGWHADFTIEPVLAEKRLELFDKVPAPPFGIFTLLRLRKVRR